MNEGFELTVQTAENLQQRIQNLASLMSTTAQSLNQGDPVELQHLVEEINGVQERMQQASRSLQDHPLLAESERYVSRTGDVLNACQEITQRQQALDLLKRLQLVKSFDANDQEAFRGLGEKIASQMNRLGTGAADERKQAVLAITGRQSPFRAIYELITRPEELSDERWSENQAAIADEFGHHVALAIVRGRAR